MIDDENLDCAFGRLQFQGELLRQGGKDVPGRLRGHQPEKRVRLAEFGQKANIPL